MLNFLSSANCVIGVRKLGAASSVGELAAVPFAVAAARGECDSVAPRLPSANLTFKMRVMAGSR